METYKPVGVPKRFICVDQGGEIYGSDAIKKVLAKHNCEMYTTGANASYQNPCERTHRTLADTV